MGKLCYLYDIAGADVTSQNTVIATAADQVATGLVIDNPAVLLFGANLSSLQGAVNAGPVSIQSLCSSLALQYMQLALFTASFTGTAPASSSAAAIIAALVVEMGVAPTAKFTALSATGLANFFNVIYGSLQTWPSSGTNTYADATYVVSAVI